MLIFGHPILPSPSLYHIDSIEAIASTPPNSTVLFSYAESNRDIMLHCRDNDVPFALYVASVTEALFAENFGVRFLVTDAALARSVQKVAETYLFDAKILAQVSDDEQIETLAFEGIDGVIFAEAIIKITT